MEPLTDAEIDRLWALVKPLLGAITRDEFDAATRDSAGGQPLSLNVTARGVEIVTAQAKLNIPRSRLSSNLLT